MDLSRKRWIRRISIPLFWISEAILLFALATGIYVKYYEEELSEAMIGAQASHELVMADEVLLNTLTRLSSQKEEGLIWFLPPQDKTDLSLWAARVKEHMDVECAVFLYDGKTMRWPLLPSRFESRVTLVDSLVHQLVKSDSLGKVKQLGYYEVLTLFSGKEALPRVVMVGPKDSEFKWGAIFDLRESYWQTFPRRLSESREMVFDLNLTELSAVFDMKKSAIRPDSVANKSKFGLQIFSQSDSLLFETPGIDTSFHKFRQRHDEIPTYSIVYLPGWSEEFLQMVKGYFVKDFEVPWHKLVFPVFLMIVLALFHSWIGKLTIE